LQQSCDKPVFARVNMEFDKALYSSSSQSSVQNDKLFEDAKIWIKQHLAEDKLELNNPC
jgi:hypothetical protein